ncbi:Uncharacterised protein [Vibrio cholerae]|nr:Uncharacterised protein [Vibrio cholerae]
MIATRLHPDCHALAGLNSHSVNLCPVTHPARRTDTWPRSPECLTPEPQRDNPLPPTWATALSPDSVVDQTVYRHPAD